MRTFSSTPQGVLTHVRARIASVHITQRQLASLLSLAVVVLIGERPGLSATDSLGLCITWAPRRGRTDAERNCISNVRPGGLSYDEAADKTAWLLRAAQGLGATGVALKDEMPAGALPAP